MSEKPTDECVSSGVTFVKYWLIFFFCKKAVSCSCLLILYPVPMFTYHLICQDSVLVVALHILNSSLRVQEGIQAFILLNEWEGESPGAGGKVIL